MLGWVIALVALAVVIWVSVTNDGHAVDRQSYEKGYDAFVGEGHYLVRALQDRKSEEAFCGVLRAQIPRNELVGVNRHDWVQGCADYVGKKPNRFS